MPASTNIRILLWLTLVAALFLNYTAWLRDFPQRAPPSLLATTPLDNSMPTATAPSTAAAPVAAAAATATVSAVNSAVPAAGSVHVLTDVLDVQVGLAGGELVRADLIKYPQAKNQPNVPVRLLNRDGAESLFVVQSGLAGIAGSDAPTHQALYSAKVSELRLAPGENELSLPLTWSDNGVTVTKTLTFRRGQYSIGLDYRIDNGGSSPWSFAPYSQILRNNPPVERSMFHVDSYAFKGPAIYDGQKYQKLDISKAPTLDQEVQQGWIAALQYEFVAAVVPLNPVPYRYQLKVQGNQFLLSATGPTESVPAGGSAEVRETVFVGPKLQAQLEQAGPRLDLVADYGNLRIIAKPLFWLLETVHGLIGNWGFTIIIVTCLLKLLFYPLSEASGRSMAKMKALAPRINALRETYKDDRDKLNRSMMEIYQREKVNPLAGCLPMLIQIPVLLAFYWVLRDSVEIRQAPFIFWIDDLSSRDPYFILPAIMAAANFLQYKLNPQMGDPMQQKVMMFMPIAMSFMFAFFPAGLVLYWVTNTLLSILQQWNINRRISAVARARN